MAIRSRLLHGIAANGFNQIVTIGIQIISVPIFLYFWGIELYGEWLILSTISIYLAQSDIGFSTVATNEMAMLVSQGDRSTALVIFNSTWLFILVVSLFVGVVFFPSVYFLPFKEWFQITQQTHFEVVGVIILLTLHVLVGLQTRLLIAGFRCEGHYALGTFLNSFIYLFEFIAITVVIFFGARPIFGALTFLIIRSIGTIAMRVVLYNKSPWIIYGYRYATLETIKRLTRPAIAFMSLPLGNMIKDQGMITIIAIFLGAPAVVVFSTIRTITNAGYQLIAMINNAVWPEVSLAYGHHNLELVKKLHHHAFQSSVALSFLSMTGLFFIGEWLIHVWTLGKVIPESDFFYLMLLVILVNAFWQASSIIPFAINKHEKITIFYLGVTTISLLFALWQIPVLGLNGAALALLIINLCMSFYVLKSVLILLNETPAHFLRAIITPPSISLLSKR